MAYPQHQLEWNESICGCFDDFGICCQGWFCPQSLFGKNAEKIDDSSCFGMCCLYLLLSSCGLCWIPHCSKRGILRQKYNLKEDPCGDCPTAFCCGSLALCQEARFLKKITAQPAGVVITRGVPPNQSTINQHQPRGYY